MKIHQGFCTKKCFSWFFHFTWFVVQLCTDLLLVNSANVSRIGWWTSSTWICPWWHGWVDTRSHARTVERSDSQGWPSPMQLGCMIICGDVWRLCCSNIKPPEGTLVNAKGHVGRHDLLWKLLCHMSHCPYVYIQAREFFSGSSFDFGKGHFNLTWGC